MTEQIAERPALAVGLLALGPLLFALAALYWVLRKLRVVGEREELRHEHLISRFHDTVATHPELGLLLYLVFGVLVLALGLAVIAGVMFLASHL